MSPRNARLTQSLSGTNLERAGDYNQRVVLQAVRLHAETTRNELVALTGLTPPTIANITRRLASAGLIRTVGRLQQGRGQPAVRLAVDPDGAFGIGITIDRDHLTLVVLDLAGTIRARVSLEIAYALPERVHAFVADALDTLRQSPEILPERIIGAGIAVPEPFSKKGFHGQPDGYAVWDGIDVVALLQDLLPWPIHLDNDAAAAALGEFEFGLRRASHSFFYLLIGMGIGGGLVINGSFYRGASGRSGEIGFILDRTAGSPGKSLEGGVSLSALYNRLEEAGCASGTPESIRSPDTRAAAIIAEWIAEAAGLLIDPMIAVNCLINPHAVLIGGRLPEPLIDALVAALTERLVAVAHAMPAIAPIRRASMAGDAPAIGAALLPFSDRMLPSDSILMNTAGIAAML